MAGSSSTKKRALVIGVSIIGVLVILVLALPFIINVDHFRPQIEAQLKSSLGRQVMIGRLNLSVLAGGISAEKVIIADDPVFSNDPFVVAKSLDIGLEWWPLISSRAIRINSLTLQDPQLTLLRSPSGKWNFSTLGAPAAKPQPAKSSSSSTAPTNFSIQSLKIANGTITVGRAHSAGKKYAYQNVDLTAKNIAYGSTIPFTLTAKTPPDGKLKVEGSAGPLDQKDMAQTPLEARVTINNLDLSSTGFVDPSSGIAGLLDYDGELKSNGRVVHTQGKAKVAKLRLVKAGAPARQPVTLDYVSDYDVERQTGMLNKGDIHIGSSTTHLSGNYDTHGEAAVVRMKLQGSNLPVQDIEGLLPAFGVVLPAGSSLQGGTISTDLALNGPVDRLVTSGPINIANARLAGFDLGSKMASVAKLAGVKTGGDTLIQTLSSQLQVAPEGIKADNLNLVIANLGGLTGAGTIGANNQLNFKMLAKFAHSGNTIAGLANTLGLGNAQDGIPFLVQGTTSNPVFVPDVGALARGKLASPAANPADPNSSQQKGLGGLLNGILGKKKPQ